MTEGPFDEDERKTLHTLAEMFEDKADREALRVILKQGVTITQLVHAYRGQKYLVNSLKATGGLLIIVGGGWAVLKGFGINIGVMK